MPPPSASRPASFRPCPPRCTFPPRLLQAHSPHVASCGVRPHVLQVAPRSRTTTRDLWSSLRRARSTPHTSSARSSWSSSGHPPTSSTLAVSRESERGSRSDSELRICFAAAASTRPQQPERSRPDPDFGPDRPSPPHRTYLLLPTCRNTWTALEAMQMRLASASGAGATAVRAGERWAAVRARGSRWSAALSAMLAQWRVRAACASGQEHPYALN